MAPRIKLESNFDIQARPPAGKYTIFGEIAEGEDVLERINAAYCDKQNRPYRNIRIKHTIVLDDPFEEEAEVKKEGDDAEDEPASPLPQVLRGVAMLAAIRVAKRVACCYTCLANVLLVAKRVAMV